MVCGSRESRRGSAREGEVLTLLDKGGTNRALADTLVVTLDTVKRHVTDILKGLGRRTGPGRSRWSAISACCSGDPTFEVVRSRPDSDEFRPRRRSALPATT